MLEDMNLTGDEEVEPATPDEIQAEIENSQKKKLPFEEALEKDERERLRRIGEQDDQESERLAA